MPLPPDDVIEWINLPTEERKASTSRPISFINFQSHVVVTAEHMLVFEPEGIAMDDPSVEWIMVETELDFSSEDILDLTEIKVDAIPLGFSHTDLVVAWDYEFNPHCILLSRENYSYFYVVDPEFSSTATLVRKCISVETQPHVCVKGADGFAIEVNPTKNFFDLANQVKESHPGLLAQELSAEEMKKISDVINEFDSIIMSELA